jgi:hypothetical protein
MVLPVLPCVPVIRRRCPPPQYPQEPLHGDAQLRHLLVGLLPVLDGLPDAVLDVVLEQDERDLLGGGDDARDLGEDIHAVGFLLDHALQTPHLALYPPQAVLELVFVLGPDMPAQLFCTSR